MTNAGRLRSIGEYRHHWFSESRGRRAEVILATINDGRLPPQQRERQADHYLGVILADLLESQGVVARPLPEAATLPRKTVDEEELPDRAIDIAYAIEQLPLPIKIEEWAILEDPPQPRRYRSNDPHLCMRIGPFRWYSVFDWEK